MNIYYGTHSILAHRCKKISEYLPGSGYGILLLLCYIFINKIFDIQENTADLGGRAKSLIVSLTHSLWHDVAGPQETGIGLGFLMPLRIKQVGSIKRGLNLTKIREGGGFFRRMDMEERNKEERPNTEEKFRTKECIR